MKFNIELMPRIAFLITIVLIFHALCFSQSAEKSLNCVFDKEKLRFEGDSVEQAKCLLRHVKMYGELDIELETLPQPLEKLIGNKVKISKKKLRGHLKIQGIKEDDIGGSLDAKLSNAKLPSSKFVYANYFLIHDASTPNYLDKPFPENINESSWAVNDLEKRWKSTKVAHLFINRIGVSITTVDFGLALPDKNFGTKFARDVLKADAKGLQIHIELIQPRQSDPNGFQGNDGIAPVPGFTQAQYDRLALVYLAASVRRGKWLIPAFHAAMDAGIKDAHDDPQNFDLEQWAKSIASLVNTLR